MQSFFQSVIHRHTEFQPNYSVSYQTSNFHAVVFPINYSQKESATTYRSSAVCCADHKKTGERKQKKKKNKRQKTQKNLKTQVSTTLSLPHPHCLYILTSSSESLSESTASGNWTTLSLGRSRSLSDQLWRLSTSVAMLPFNRFSASTARQAGRGLQQNKNLPLLFCIMICQGFFP